ncbi:hypothetical protein [Commensalibacter oyaizuii]|uniref:Uncharacterized protein n=1 Tax=Commensalibacter oyaizuii TaxID=3043873 RepID=A0ABT6Q0H5_9PROT|nr:hypothetical protein [Commensalibacter sp. TBRC 16381]MDI2090620.1 hypothetical protein [Commensalibacter sp. TBRC 16381]
MNEKIDPKELKVLADILALVLEDQPGQSLNALETIKKRAKRNTVTGGALKNLFTSIANSPPKNNTTNFYSNPGNDSAELRKARSRITELTHSINRLDATIKSLRRNNESLRSELRLTQESRAEIQSALHASEAKSPFKATVIIVSLLCGLFCGIAGTAVVHSLTAKPPLPDNTIYLQ